MDRAGAGGPERCGRQSVAGLVTRQRGADVPRAVASSERAHPRPRGPVAGASHGERAVVRREPDGRWQIVADRFGSQQFNAPNDLVVAADGAIWFTDPRYGIDRPEEGYGGEVEIPGCRIYRIAPDGDVAAVSAPMPAPNGLAFSGDQQVLYVADSEQGLILAFPVIGDRLGEPAEIVAPDEVGIPDGLRLDTDGRIWTSWGPQVRVYVPDGYDKAQFLGAIELPQTVSNLAFGGPDKGTLAITATSGLHRVQTTVVGGGY
nr:SMP-30/gluconolactonase/LRE family protein [Naumannella halotolerans]